MMRRAKWRQRPPEVSPPTPTMPISSSFFKARRSGRQKSHHVLRDFIRPYPCSFVLLVFLQRRTFFFVCRTGQIFGQPLPHFVCHGPNGQAGVLWNWRRHRKPWIRKHTAQISQIRKHAAGMARVFHRRLGVGPKLHRSTADKLKGADRKTPFRISNPNTNGSLATLKGTGVVIGKGNCPSNIVACVEIPH
jgi:hypothetical protein